MSDQPEVTAVTPESQSAPAAVALAEPPARVFEEGGLTEVVLNDLGSMSLSDAIDATLVEFEEGGLVSGIVVKIDADEVLLDIGFKSEGIIPKKELSIRNDVNPSEIVSIGERIEALVLQKEDKE